MSVLPVTAIVRGVPASFGRAISRGVPAEPIDVDRARAEHGAYVRALRELGVAVLERPPDDRFPDCCFVEDCAVVHEGLALIMRPGAPSRRGEPDALRSVLAHHARVVLMETPATMDGGDCLRLGDRLYVGQSTRTNAAGIEQAREVFSAVGLVVVPVTVVPSREGELHLKCVCSPIGQNKLLLAEGALEPSIFGDADVVLAPREESYAANCVAIGDAVLVSSGFPATAHALRASGLRVLPVQTEQIRKADGALTCLSIRIGGL